MQNFINYVCEFVMSIYRAIRAYFISLDTGTGTYWRDLFSNFINKNVFTETSIIGINITFEELLTIVICIFLSILILVLFVKFVLKMLKVITN